MTSSRPLGKIWPLKVSRGAAQIGVTLVIVPESVASQLNESSGFLGPGEREYFSTLKFVRRRQSYLLGRYAAKMAVAHQVGEIDLRAIEILRGVFEQPIVHCVRSDGWCVSISHADTLAAALAFPAPVILWASISKALIQLATKRYSHSCRRRKGSGSKRRTEKIRCSWQLLFGRLRKLCRRFYVRD